MKPKILIITPIKHIKELYKNFESCFEIKYIPEATYNEVLKQSKNIDCIFTNPNKSKVFINKNIISNSKVLKVIATASTGTNHIDVKFAKKKKIKIFSLKNQYETIKQISSTAEHAFALMFSSLRNIPQSMNSVKKNKWDYTNFIGRQMNHLSIGVIGYGRLGSFFCRYCKAFNSKIFVYDPYKKIPKIYNEVRNLKDLVLKSDIISLHVHLDANTKNLIDSKIFRYMKKDVILINTSRGEIINEGDLINFLKKNPGAKYAADVISNEVNSKKNKLLHFYKKNYMKKNIIITPHIGGMTTEAQLLAYNASFKQIYNFFFDV